MTEGRQPFTGEIKTLAKGPSTYDPLENAIRRHRPVGSRKWRPFIGISQHLFYTLENRSEPINVVIDEVGLDKWRFAGNLSSEWRKQSERNEADNGRQIRLRTTE
jgi:hypothetical protein